MKMVSCQNHLLQALALSLLVEKLDMQHSIGRNTKMRCRGAFNNWHLLFTLCCHPNLQNNAIAKQHLDISHEAAGAWEVIKTQSLMDTSVLYLPD